jgi:hypothetical protein
MENAEEFIARTQSAVESLFGGIRSYLQILESARPPVLVGSYSSELEHKKAVEDWTRENEASIEASFKAQRAFMSERYALAVLCGSLLQVATMAIRLHSKNRLIPDEFHGIVNPSHAPFCVGRRVRDVPIGLIIIAARNQYNHIEDGNLHKLSSGIFEWLATKHGFGLDIRDPAFDLDKNLAWNYASNVTGLLGWRRYEDYVDDMRSLLGI